ncbi:MAG: T9SS type A sorting domain-containing protein [Candidatus Marinimicrobia bacterium]|nr:T9SS type A sorting domain-containing protein [Candidatus Neomarinimicrobiota bacterium]
MIKSLLKIFCILFLLATALDAGIIAVPNDYPSIQSALNAAMKNDSILVEAGVYHENLLWPETSGITLLGNGHPDNVIIDGKNQASVLKMFCLKAVIDTTTKIENFTLRGGGNTMLGGGIYLSNKASPQLINLTITENSAFDGGGIFCGDSSSPTIINSILKLNRAKNVGGGIQITNGASVDLRQCNLISNNAYAGGGIYLSTGSKVLVPQTTVIGKNSANDGGGVYIEGEINSSIENMIIIENKADRYGAGICFISQIWHESLIVEGCAIIGNEGEGVYASSSIFYSGSDISSISISKTTFNRNAIGIHHRIITGSVEHCTFSRNDIGILSSRSWSTQSYTNNNFECNRYAISHTWDAPEWVQATNNWYHLPTGPAAYGFINEYYWAWFGDALDGLDSISYVPFLTQPDTVAPPLSPPPQIVEDYGLTFEVLDNQTVKLSWKMFNDLGIEGYKICSTKDTNALFMDDTIDIGDNTSYNLPIEMNTYYDVAVISYDSHGNHSWYSEFIRISSRVVMVNNLQIINEDSNAVVSENPIFSFSSFDSWGMEKDGFEFEVSSDSSFSTVDLWDFESYSAADTMIHYSGHPLIEGESYHARLRVNYDGQYSDWKLYNFKMYKSLDVPNVLFPRDGHVYTDSIISVLLKVPQANDSIPVYIYTMPLNSDFSMNLCGFTDKVGSNVDTVRFNYQYWNSCFEENEKYYLTFSAFDDYGQSDNSDTIAIYFNLLEEPPAPFQLLHPKGGQIIRSLEEQFVWSWSDAVDPRDSIKYTININSIDSSYSFVQELTDTIIAFPPDILDLQRYQWQVEATDLRGNSIFNSNDVQEFVLNLEETLSQSELMYPEDKTILEYSELEFRWNSIQPVFQEASIQYYLLFGRNESALADVYTGSDTTFVLNGLEDAFYYWQVLAEDHFGGSSQSRVSTFFIDAINEAPSVATPIYPDSIQTESLHPVLSWSSASDPDPSDSIFYEIHLWSDSFYKYKISKTDSCLLDTALNDNTIYSWFVKAVDSHDASSKSEKAHFWTDSFPEPPGSFSLVSPQSGEVLESENVLLSWEPAIDPDPMEILEYLVRIKSKHVDSLVWHEHDAKSDSTMSLVLEMGHQYEWQVMVMDLDGFVVSNDSGAINSFDVGSHTGIDLVEIPINYELQQNYPNPFNPSTTIQYGLPEAANVSLVVYDLQGNEIKTLVSDNQLAGWYEITWEGNDKNGQTIPTSVYLAKIQAGKFSKVIKMVYLK